MKNEDLKQAVLKRLENILSAFPDILQVYKEKIENLKTEEIDFPKKLLIDFLKSDDLSNLTRL